MNVLNKLLILFFIAIMTGCASAYKPSQGALALSNSMTKQDAVNMIKTSFITADRGDGICRANGLPGESLIDAGWTLNRKKPNVTANSDEISFNAGRGIITHYSQGLSAGYASTTNYVPIRRTIKYAELESATIYKEVGLLSMVCQFDEDEVEVRFNLTEGLGHWFNVVIKEQELDRFVAALMIVSPKIELNIN
mgnify:CR=1 FL=1